MNYGTILLYLGAAAALSSGVAGVVHALKADETPVGKVILTVCTDIIGFARILLGSKTPEGGAK